jgi:hypothetical protein
MDLKIVPQQSGAFTARMIRKTKIIRVLGILTEASG